MADGPQVDGHADDTKLHGKPDKTLRFSLCSDNLEGISEGQCAVVAHSTVRLCAADIYFHSPHDDELL